MTESAANMKHTIQQAFHSGKFVAGFSIFTTIIPLVLKNVSASCEKCTTFNYWPGTFFEPGIYVNVYDGVFIGAPQYTLNLEGAEAKRNSQPDEGEIGSPSRSTSSPPAYLQRKSIRKIHSNCSSSGSAPSTGQADSGDD